MDATDPDSSSKITFDIKPRDTGSRNFRIDKTTGALYSDATFDRETRSAYTLTVRATDEGGLSTEANVTVNVLDANDNAPLFSESSIQVRALKFRFYIYVSKNIVPKPVFFTMHLFP